ncbi:MAG: LiaF transmembrane domain-containing protein [Anaerolineaceae bacterium]
MDNNNIDNRQPLNEGESKRSGGWIIGTILVVLGAVFLMQNAGLLPQHIGNWWAIFIMIPALAGYVSSLDELRSTGTLSRKSRSSLVFSVLLTLLSAFLFFGLDFNFFGPLLLICAGLGIFLSSFKDR